MEENEISDGLARKELLPLIHALFMGITLRLPNGRLCYRGTREALPDLPGATADEIAVATEAGLFRSCERTAGGDLVDEVWLRVGDFASLSDELELLDAPADLPLRITMDMAVRSAFWRTPSGRNADHLVLNMADWRGGPQSTTRPAERCRS